MVTEVITADEIKLESNPTRQVAAFRVIDTDGWNRTLSGLLSTFGKIVVDEYGRPENIIYGRDFLKETVYQLRLSLKGVTSMYVASEQERVVGFCALEELEGGVCVVREMLVAREARGRGIGEALYLEVHSDENVKELIGYSKTPSAMHLRLKIASILGWRVSFGDMDHGHEVCRLQDILMEYMRQEDLLADHIAPEGFAYLKGEVGILPKLESVESNFATNHPLYPQFKKLEKLQQNNPKDVAVGIAITINPKVT